MAKAPNKVELRFDAGSPRALSVAFGDKTIAFVFTKEELQTAKAKIKAHGKGNLAGIYTLIKTNSNEPSNFSFYVGRTNNVLERLDYHKSKGIKWTETAVFINRLNEDFGTTQIEYFESSLFNKMHKIAKATNDQKPKGQFKGPHRNQEEFEPILEEAVLLFDILGCQFFRELYSVEYLDSSGHLNNKKSRKKHVIKTEPESEATRQQGDSIQPKEEPDDSALFEGGGKRFKAYMKINTDKTVIVKKNSLISATMGKIFNSGMRDIENIRQSLISDKKILLEDDKIRLMQDVKLKSANQAAIFVSGSNRSANKFWKYYDHNNKEWLNPKEYKIMRSNITNQNVFSHENKKENFKATMIHKSDKELVVIKGSKARLEVSLNATEQLKKIRKDLTESQILSQSGEFLVFTKNCKFISPSAAGSVIAGYGVNGRNFWIHSDGTTYGDWVKKKR